MPDNGARRVVITPGFIAALVAEAKQAARFEIISRIGLCPSGCKGNGPPQVRSVSPVLSQRSECLFNHIVFEFFPWSALQEILPVFCNPGGLGDDFQHGWIGWDQ